MKQLAQCPSLAEVRGNIDRRMAAPVTERGAFVPAGREANAALHPPSPTNN